MTAIAWMASSAGRRRNCLIYCWKTAWATRKSGAPKGAENSMRKSRPNWTRYAGRIWHSAGRKQHEHILVFDSPDIEGSVRPCGAGPYAVHLDLRGDRVPLQHGAGSGQRGALPAGCRTAVTV